MPNPTVDGPVEGGIVGRPWMSSLEPVEPHGFVEEEFFFSGTSEGIPYTSRFIVRRPADGNFSGTVVFDWINVTGGMDLETLWPPMYPVFFSERHAYVGITAQIVGVQGLQTWDPVRYAPLLHPGDFPHSYNILAQAVQAVRSPEGVDPMGGLDVERVIVGGSSQSGLRLTDYIVQGYPVVGHIDAFLISRIGGGAPLKAFADANQIPIFHGIEEEVAVQPSDSDYYRVWEGAGQAHAPKAWYDYVWATAYTRDRAYGLDLPPAVDIGCSMNRGTVQYSGRIGLHWMHRWVADGTPIPSVPRIERAADGSVVRDADGHAVGGLRMPFVEVPVGLNTANGCPLFGEFRAWSRDKLLSLYPTHEDYVSKVAAHADLLVSQELLLPSDAAEIKAEAETFDVWSAGSCYDMGQPSVDESGPVSGALKGARNEHSPVGASAPTVIGAVSCSAAGAGL